MLTQVESIRNETNTVKLTMYLKCVGFLVLLFFVNNVVGMTRQQLKNSGKLLKKTCMPKNGVTEDQVGEIQQGVFIQDRNVMCYIACVYTVGQVVKNNKIVHDALIKQVDMMFPAEIKDAVKFTIEKCKGVAKEHKDICEGSYYTAKCMYDADPAVFVFP